jgi:hypothetical protein
VCGSWFTGFVGGVIATRLACVTFEVSSLCARPHTVSVAVGPSKCLTALNAAGTAPARQTLHITARIVLELRRSHQLPSQADRLRARGLLTLPEIAEQLGVHISTIKAWRRAGLLTAGNDKNIRLFDPPAPGDPRLVKRMDSSISKRAAAAPRNPQPCPAPPARRTS